VITLLTCATLLVVAVWVLALVFREAPEFDEVCIEDGCFRTATHQRPDGMTSGGTPIVELVCRRHGRIPR
jgi:hypothetical protein